MSVSKSRAILEATTPKRTQPPHLISTVLADCHQCPNIPQVMPRLHFCGFSVTLLSDLAIWGYGVRLVSHPSSRAILVIILLSSLPLLSREKQPRLNKHRTNANFLQPTTMHSFAFQALLSSFNANDGMLWLW